MLFNLEIGRYVGPTCWDQAKCCFVQCPLWKQQERWARGTAVKTAQSCQSVIHGGGNWSKAGGRNHAGLKFLYRDTRGRAGSRRLRSRVRACLRSGVVPRIPTRSNPHTRIKFNFHSRSQKLDEFEHDVSDIRVHHQFSFSADALLSLLSFGTQPTVD